MIRVSFISQDLYNMNGEFSLLYSRRNAWSLLIVVNWGANRIAVAFFATVLPPCLVFIILLNMDLTKVQERQWGHWAMIDHAFNLIVCRFVGTLAWHCIQIIFQRSHVLATGPISTTLFRNHATIYISNFRSNFHQLDPRWLFIFTIFLQILVFLSDGFDGKKNED